MLSKKILSKKKIVSHNLGQNIDFFTFSHSNFLSQVKWNWIIITREYMYELGLETLDLRKLRGDRLLSNLPSKNYFLAKAAKTSAKGEIKVF